jgi:hypothetical protein
MHHRNDTVIGFISGIVGGWNKKLCSTGINLTTGSTQFLVMIC